MKKREKCVYIYIYIYIYIYRERERERERDREGDLMARLCIIYACSQHCVTSHCVYCSEPEVVSQKT